MIGLNRNWSKKNNFSEFFNLWFRVNKIVQTGQKIEQDGSCESVRSTVCSKLALKDAKQPLISVRETVGSI